MPPIDLNMRQKPPILTNFDYDITILSIANILPILWYYPYCPHGAIQLAKSVSLDYEIRLNRLDGHDPQLAFLPDLVDDFQFSYYF